MPNDKKGKGGTYIPETAYLGTDGGPASAPTKADRPAVKQAKLVGEVAGSMPHNDTKASEYGRPGAEEGGYRPDRQLSRCTCGGQGRGGNRGPDRFHDQAPAFRA